MVVAKELERCNNSNQHIIILLNIIVNSMSLV